MAVALRWLLLPILTLVFFKPLVDTPTGLIGTGDSDVIYQHYPAKHFWVSSTQQTGEMPLWAPDQFAGSPFVHDPQVGMFYPLHWPMLKLPLSALAAYMSWLVVLHILIAGVGMFCYARFRGMSVFAAQITAIGFMFSGKWLMHMLLAGHTILSGLAWLPWAILALEWAITRGRVLGALAGGLAFGMLALSVQPQWTLYAGVFVVVWLMGAVCETHSTDADRPRRRWMRYLLYGILAGGIALGLYAVQMLPTMHAAQASSRALPSIAIQEIIPWQEKAGSLIGPTYVSEQHAWESNSSIGGLWIILAAYAIAIGSFRVRFVAAVLVGMLVLACLPEAFWAKIPGFRLFRFHGRITTFAAFPVSILVGMLTDAWRAGQGPALARRGLMYVLITIITLLVLVGIFLQQCYTYHQPQLYLNPYWLILILTAGIMLLMLTGRIRLRPTFAHLFWLGALLMDLWRPMTGYVVVRPVDEAYPVIPVVEWLRTEAQPHARMMDRAWDFAMTGAPSLARTDPTPIGIGAHQAVLHQIPSVIGYNPVDVRWYRDYWLRIQNRPENIPPQSDLVQSPYLGDVPIRNPRLIDLLGVRYAVMPVDRPPPTNWIKRIEQPPSQTLGDIHVEPVKLPAYAVYENPNADPRAFMVEQLKPLPTGDALITAFQQENFHKVALVEDLPADYPQPQAGASARAVKIDAYTPNRVTLSVESGPAGTLVLTDVWFSEWVARVNGEVVPIVRVNSTFRGVPIPATASTVVFTLESRSLRWGLRITIGTMIFMMSFVMGRWLIQRWIIRMA